MGNVAVVSRRHSIISLLIGDASRRNTIVPEPAPQPVSLKELRQKGKLLDSFQIVVDKNATNQRYDNECDDYGDDVVMFTQPLYNNESHHQHHQHHQHHFQQNNLLSSPRKDGTSKTVDGRWDDETPITSNSSSTSSNNPVNSLPKTRSGVPLMQEEINSRINCNFKTLASYDNELMSGSWKRRGSRQSDIDSMTTPRQIMSLESNGRLYDIQPRRYSVESNASQQSDRRLTSESSALFSDKLHQSLSMRTQNLSSNNVNANVNARRRSSIDNALDIPRINEEMETSQRKMNDNKCNDDMEVIAL